MVVLLHVFQTEQSEKDSTEHSTVQQNIEMTLSIQETIHQTMLWGKRQVRRSNWDTWNEWRANVVSMSQGQTKQTRSLETNLVGFCHFSKAFLCFLDQGFSANKKSKNTRWGVQVLCKLTFQKMYGSMPGLHLTVGGPAHVSSLNKKTHRPGRQLELKRRSSLEIW